MIKNYIQQVGDCSECCLTQECNKNKQGIKDFLATKKIKCVNGQTIKIGVDSEQD